jgi:hypothetical protein
LIRLLAAYDSSALRRIACAGVVGLGLPVLLVVTGCGGSTDSPVSPGTGSGAVSATQPASEDPGTETAAGSGLPDFDDITPIAPDPVAPDSPDALLGSTPDYRAAAALTRTLEGAGMPPGAFAVYVLPISGTDSSLLVLEVDDQNPDVDGISEEVLTGMFSALVEAPETSNANVVRLALNYQTTDEQGPATVVLTLPIDIVAGYLDGTVSDEQFSQNVKFLVHR